MNKWMCYYECIAISREAVSFRIEIYDNETGEMVAKANNLINRRTRKGNVDWIVKRGTLSPISPTEIHKHCLKRMEESGL